MALVLCERPTGVSWDCYRWLGQSLEAAGPQSGQEKGSQVLD